MPSLKYDFEAYWMLVRQLQPRAVIFSDEGPDVRWIGNEHGFAGETCWSKMDRNKVSVGHADTKYLNHGEPHGPNWVPGECDVSIRDSWFWHKDQQPKSVEQLLDIYFKSVGRNGVLLLNVPPDDRGLLADSDVERLRQFRRALDSIFKNDLAANKLATASNVRGGSSDFRAGRALDGILDTYWATDDSLVSGWIEVDLGKSEKFNLARLQEPIAMGQRVEAYHLEIGDGQTWNTVARGTTIGYKKLDRFAAVTARRVRLVIDKSQACPLIAEFGLYFNPLARPD